MIKLAGSAYLPTWGAPLRPEVRRASSFISSVAGPYRLNRSVREQLRLFHGRSTPLVREQGPDPAAAGTGK